MRAKPDRASTFGAWKKPKTDSAEQIAKLRKEWDGKVDAAYSSHAPKTSK